MASRSNGLEGSSSSVHFGYEIVVDQLETLLTSYPPPFMFVYDPEAPRITSSVVRSVLQSLSNPPSAPQLSSKQLTYACINAIACFTPRLFYDTVLNALVRWNPRWEDGCANWSSAGVEAQRWNENLDTFLRGLRAICSEMETTSNNSAKRKGKARATPSNLIQEDGYRLVLVVERAERFKENLQDLLVPLTRLAELVSLSASIVIYIALQNSVFVAKFSMPILHLITSYVAATIGCIDYISLSSQSRVDIVTIFISDVRWEDIRPPLGASPEPYYIDVPVLSKQGLFLS